MGLLCEPAGDGSTSSNREISPLYQSVRDIQNNDVPFGEPPRPILDPLFFWNLRILCEKLTLLGLVYHNGKVIMTEEVIG